MSQAELSRKTGIRSTTIGELYNELVDRINLEHIDKICDVLDCEVEDLLVKVPDDLSEKEVVKYLRQRGK